MQKLFRLFTACWLALSLKGTAAESAQPATVDATTTKVTHVDATGAQKLVKEGKVVILDIRTPDEFAAGHLKGAKLINFQAGDFEKKLGELDKSKPYLVHCASGRRSTKSLETFTKLGFKDVVHLDGGIKAWQAAGAPVEK
jgi:phage shock protein E